MTCTTRFAPSPTGNLHIGGARTALFSWLFARQQQGQCVLRIEDTDLKRSTQSAVDAILQAMEWLELDYDQGPFYQTQRMDRYRQVVQQLLDQGHAYHCYCSPEHLEKTRQQQLANRQKPRYDHTHRDFTGTPPPEVAPVVRFKNPLDGEVVIDDWIHGAITIRNEELDDLIIARADGSPTYNLCVVIDDMDMGITHVIRGDDHINNTPRQINILKALGANIPQYAHVPMILGEDGKRLSKRHGAVNVMQFRDEGILPQALLNYLVRLGWAHGDQEIFSRQEMIQYFDLRHVNRSAAAIDYQKLLWLNQHYLQTLAMDQLLPHVHWQLSQQKINTESGPDLVSVVNVLRKRANTLVDLVAQSRFCYQAPCYDNNPQATQYLTIANQKLLQTVRDHLAALPEDQWQVTALKNHIKQWVKQQGVKFPQLAQPMRVALTGSTQSPSIDETVFLVGQLASVERLDGAIEWINKNN